MLPGHSVGHHVYRWNLRRTRATHSPATHLAVMMQLQTAIRVLLPEGTPRRILQSSLAAKRHERRKNLPALFAPLVPFRGHCPGLRVGGTPPRGVLSSERVSTADFADNADKGIVIRISSAPSLKSAVQCLVCRFDCRSAAAGASCTIRLIRSGLREIHSQT